MALPRLTEEGNRPTMRELDLADQPGTGQNTTQPLSPTISLPEGGRAEAAAGDGHGRWNWSLRGSHASWRPRRTMMPDGGVGQQYDGAPIHQPRTQAYAEYDAIIVDYLDTIGKIISALSAPSILFLEY